MSEASKEQVGGSHYKDRAIQPIEYILANGLDFCEGNVIKYVTRWKDKNGVEDLKKAKQYLEFLIEDAEKKVGSPEESGVLKSCATCIFSHMNIDVSPCDACDALFSHWEKNEEKPCLTCYYRSHVNREAAYIMCGSCDNSYSNWRKGDE